MSVAVCLLLYGAVVCVVAPRLLPYMTRGGSAPVAAVAVWLIAVASVLVSWVTAAAALVVYAASCEEQFLADAFPEQFHSYTVATPNKWWPRARNTPLPDHLEVQPAVFWKAFLDAGSFFLLYLLVALAAEYRLVPAL